MFHLCRAADTTVRNSATEAYSLCSGYATALAWFAFFTHLYRSSIAASVFAGSHECFCKDPSKPIKSAATGECIEGKFIGTKPYCGMRERLCFDIGLCTRDRGRSPLASFLVSGEDS